GVIAADIHGGKRLAGQHKADDLAVDVTVRIALAVLRPVDGGDRRDGQVSAAVRTGHAVAAVRRQTDGRWPETRCAPEPGEHQWRGHRQAPTAFVEVVRM